MKQRILKLLLTTLLATSAGQALALTQAPNLLDVFNQSLAGDPQWLAYKATLLSNQELAPINRALLLPNLAISGTSEYNNRNQRASYVGVFGPSAAGLGQGVFQYSTNNYTAELTQPLFNYANWEQFQAAKASVKQATAQYVAEYQNLMQQVAQDYFNILQARDVLNYTITETKAVGQLYQQNLERYKVGLGTITDVYNAKAQLDNNISQEIAAKTNLLNNIEALRAVTGQMYTTLAGLRDNIPLLTPMPNNVEQWVSIATEQNPNIVAARYSSDAARETVKQQFAGHLPTVNAVASYSELHNGNSGFGPTNEGDGAIGVQLSIPIFAGGGVLAQTQQAQYNYQTSLSDLEQAIRTAVENTRQSFNNVVSGANRVKADKQAIVSNQSSLQSTQAAFKVGTRTIVDVLDAQTQLFQTQVTYAQDLYAYIMSIVNLKQAAGTLSPKDLAEINLWLTQNAPLSGYYSSPYTQTVPATLSIKNAPLLPPTTPQQQQEIHKTIENLPVFTPQPQSQWTTPITSSTTPTLINPPNPQTLPAQPASTTNNAPILPQVGPSVNPPNPNFMPPSLSTPGTPAAPATSTTTTTTTIPTAPSTAPTANLSAANPNAILPVPSFATAANKSPMTVVAEPSPAQPVTPAAPITLEKKSATLASNTESASDAAMAAKIAAVLEPKKTKE